MDPLRAQWLSELEADDSALMNQWQMKPVNNSVNNLHFNPYSSESYSAHPSSSTVSVHQVSQAEMAKSTKEIKNNDFSSYTSAQKPGQKVSHSASPDIISFGNSNSPKSSMHDLHGKQKFTVKTESDMMSLREMNFSAPISPSSIQQFYGTVEYGEPMKRSCHRTSLQAQDHVLAERKRRERLSEQFVALSTMIPGLKKLDKASVLGGAIKYLEQLEERIKVLEEERKRTHGESVNTSSISKRPRLASEDDTSSSDENSESCLDQDSSPEIEVRTSDTNVLVRVYCENRSGIIKDILCEIEKFHLSIISSSVIPFGSTTLNITVIAQMNSESCMSAQDIANNIRIAILKLM